MPLSEQLLAILVCPACKGDLDYDRINERLTCHACKLRYRIEDDIPIMLVEEAERLGAGPEAQPGGGAGS
jgi:uncharacterized protein YbaR (Trm112 family)